MKLKLILCVALILGLSASLAIAASSSVQKKPARTTTTKKAKPCRPNVSLILRGQLTAVSATDQFSMSVTRANRHAKAYKGQTVSINTNAATTIRRLGKKVALADLTLGDRLNVQARVCKKQIGETPPLAKRVVARPAKT